MLHEGGLLCLSDNIDLLTNIFVLKALGWCIPGISEVGRSSLLAERSSFSLVSCSAFIIFVSARFVSCFWTFQLLPANLVFCQQHDFKPFRDFFFLFV